MKMIRRISPGAERCAILTEHAPHPPCPGLVDECCPRDVWHGPHLVAPGRLCRGLGLAAICPHGEQALNCCDMCDNQGGSLPPAA